MNDKPENRIDKIVSDLLRGKRLKLRAGDAEEKAAITTAARLAGARQGPQRMHPAFRKRIEQTLGQGPESAWVTRRAAIVAGLGLAVGAAGGGLVGRALAPEVAVSYGARPIEPVNGRWFDVAALTDLVEGHGKRVSAGAVSAYVFRSGDSVSAVSSVCSHLPCELWWNAKAGVLACPCHPANFMPDGLPSSKSYHLPALNTVHARVTDAGRVEVWGAE
ncbi:MAG TPA: Rieske 2Fe-2S domain-containing protein [Candidatus Dormibacteraeota bacterium]|nr:Rieske 2Fe-2S domain-containing protein [Candidatus Dormibacteraeota bacterium]